MSYAVGDRLLFIWREQKGESYTPGTVAHILNNGKVIMKWDDKKTTVTTVAFLKQTTRKEVGK